MMICAEFHSHDSLVPRQTHILPFFNTGQASKKCTDFNTKFLFSDIFPVVTVLVIFLNSNNLSVLSSFSMYRVQTHFSSGREYLDLVSWRSIPRKATKTETWLTRQICRRPSWARSSSSSCSPPPGRPCGPGSCCAAGWGGDCWGGCSPWTGPEPSAASGRAART